MSAGCMYIFHSFSFLSNKYYKYIFFVSSSPPIGNDTNRERFAGITAAVLSAPFLGPPPQKNKYIYTWNIPIGDIIIYPPSANGCVKQTRHCGTSVVNAFLYNKYYIIYYIIIRQKHTYMGVRREECGVPLFLYYNIILCTYARAAENRKLSRPISIFSRPIRPLSNY